MTITLEVQKREDGTSVESLRANGLVPAVVYGPKQEPIAISVDAKAFDKVRAEAGESTIVDVQGLGESVEVLIKEVDFSPVKQQVMHVDLYAIERGKEITLDVELVFTGEAPAEENHIGTVTKVLHEIEVTCRPRNLPNHIDVDLSALVDEHSKITVADLPQLEGVTYEAEPEEVVAVISVAKEEVDEDPEDVNMDAVASEEKGGGDDDDTEE